MQRGAGIGVDVLQAKSRLQIAKERRVAYEGALEDATARYIQVFNHPPDLTAMPEPAPAEGLLPRDLDEAMVVAEQENPAIDGSLATVEVASERRRLARAGHYPTLNVVGAATYEKNNDLVLGTRVDYSVVLQATWNLFNGFEWTPASPRRRWSGAQAKTITTLSGARSPSPPASPGTN